MIYFSFEYIYIYIYIYITKHQLIYDIIYLKLIIIRIDHLNMFINEYYISMSYIT